MFSTALSGIGLHAWCSRCMKPRHGKHGRPLSVEVYSRGLPGLRVLADVIPDQNGSHRGGRSCSEANRARIGSGPVNRCEQLTPAIGTGRRLVCGRQAHPEMTKGSAKLVLTMRRRRPHGSSRQRAGNQSSGPKNGRRREAQKRPHARQRGLRPGHGVSRSPRTIPSSGCTAEYPIEAESDCTGAAAGQPIRSLSRGRLTDLGSPRCVRRGQLLDRQR